MAKPNIVLINCDDLGYGDIGCYGSTRNRTPVLDQMAAEGIRFTDFYMASAVCSPSRGAMMTGCYPPRIGFGSFDGPWVLFPGQGVGLNPEEKTVASYLKDEGYSTMVVGKWHCGDQKEFLPTSHGFDHYYGIPYSNDMGKQVGREKYPPLPLLRDDEVIQEQPDQAGLTERYAEECVKFIRNNKEKPFFLYMAHMYVHRPIYAPERFMRESQNGRYGAGVECVDWCAGVIMHELKQLGLDENTLVIFTSDNGSRGGDEGGSNAPLRGGKGSTWEGGMRLPCIMRWPEKIPAGQVNSEVVTSMDFLPTFVKMAGGEVETERPIDGKDITPLMFGESDAKSSRDAFYYYFLNDLEAVRCGKWKLHFKKRKDEINELYDLEADIGETKNLYDSEPDIVKELTAKANAMRQELGDEFLGIEGKACRPLGRIENPDTLTHYDPNHPYIMAMYDLADGG